MDAQEPLYFGCVDRLGHHLWTRGEERVSLLGWPKLNKQIDGGDCPKATPIEGVATLTHEEPWTILSFWDRSVDSRGGSHSTFLIPGRHNFETALAMARESFPRIFFRFRFSIRQASASAY